MSSLKPEEIIKRPIALTEKANLLREANKVVFEVARGANKVQIKKAIQSLFNVGVVDVNTLVMRGKDRGKVVLIAEAAPPGVAVVIPRIHAVLLKDLQRPAAFRSLSLFASGRANPRSS